jgi:putative CocE/NonD family hydrolase
MRFLQHVWIPTRDGTRLAARIWLPDDADRRPCPAILEYLPYRKNDLMAVRDATIQPFWAAQGYAGVRVDLRGSGDSEGHLLDEYTEQEQQDALDVIAWLAAQPWCDGSVGMIGLSWGGFNALQVAARGPEALRAIVAICASDDRYRDDVHYTGGLVGFEMMSWSATMLARLALPPDPEVWGDAWWDGWSERLEHSAPGCETWLAHPDENAYWHQGSVGTDPSKIETPVLLAGGWTDGYHNAMLRLLERLDVPRRCIMGPWGHHWPQQGIPGPAIGFLTECVRWWDQWLRGADSGIMDEPLLRAYLPDPVALAPSYPHRPGRWVSEEQWPSPSITAERWYLHPDGLDRAVPRTQTHQRVHATQELGAHAGIWCPHSEPGEFPGDQRPEDALSLTFTSQPLDAAFEILGRPVVNLELTADRPRALVAVRLCDVWPDGTSVLVTRGVLNLAHRAGHGQPSDVPPNEPIRVQVDLNAIAHRFEDGHRLRLAVSSTYWPWVWPSPEPVTLQVSNGPSAWLSLPVRPTRVDERAIRFDPPDGAVPPPVDVVQRHPSQAWLHQDRTVGSLEIGYATAPGGGRVRLVADDIEMERLEEDRFTIVHDTPLSAEMRAQRRITLARQEWDVRVEVEAVMACDATHYLTRSELRAYYRGAEVFTRVFEGRHHRGHG